MKLLDVLPPSHRSADRRVWTAGKRWSKLHLKIAFLSRPTGPDVAHEAALTTAIKAVASEWTDGTGLYFDWVDSPSNADVRIALDVGNGCWSRLGEPPPLPPDEPTMNIDGAAVPGTDVFRHYVLHEFGHMLSFVHEHQAPGLQPEWNLEAIRNELDWNDADIKHNIVDQVKAAPVSGGAPDPESVMLYAFPASWTKNGVAGRLNSKLSARDLEGAQRTYPKG